MSNIKVRPLTLLLVAVAIIFVAIGVIYFTRTAGDLPAFFPGHAAHSTKKHLKHGSAAILLALLALVGAWFTTAPAHARD